MENVKDMYEIMLRVFEKADILYEAYEKQVAENEELKTLLHKEKEDKQKLQLQLQAVSEALTEVKRNEGLQQLSSSILQSTPKVNSVEFASVSSHDIISVGSVEIPITGTGIRLLTKMGYRGGGLGICGQGITQPLQVMQRPRYAILGYSEEG